MCSRCEIPHTVVSVGGQLFALVLNFAIPIGAQAILCAAFCLGFDIAVRLAPCVGAAEGGLGQMYDSLV